MASLDDGHGILAEPLDAGSFRQCLECGRWFALERIATATTDDGRKLETYRCKRCGAEFRFVDRHPDGAI
ncbi:MAG: hypothetical protein AAGJ46_15440 [Planctomycetota bacterium]